MKIIKFERENGSEVIIPVSNIIYFERWGSTVIYLYLRDGYKETIKGNVKQTDNLFVDLLRHFNEN